MKYVFKSFSLELMTSGRLIYHDVSKLQNDFLCIWENYEFMNYDFNDVAPRPFMIIFWWPLAISE